MESRGLPTDPTGAMALEYILYCDESSDDGELYGDFFGGCILPAGKLQRISDALEAKKRELHLFGEIKWTKVTEPYVEKYCEVIHSFFDFVRSGDVRVRIMFRKKANQYRRRGVPGKDKYFKLYYQFIKHAFGFSTPASVTGEYYLHVLLDELPDHTQLADAFKEYLCKMPTISGYEASGIHIRKRDIGEVRSHDHVLLQCVDVILGAMFFRLNRLHLQIPVGASRRGKRTIAKEKLYKYILSEIRTIHPGFNIGVKTGARGREYPHWSSPYEHWEFIPNEGVRSNL